MDWEVRLTEQEQELFDRHDLQLARVLVCKRLRDEGWSLREIGRVLDISHEWVRQLSS